jgi:hypothetical protein
MNDEAFLKYGELHSQTERHAFYPDLLKLSTVEAWLKKVKE